MADTIVTSASHPIVDDFIAPQCLEPLRVLYLDRDFLLIDKPSKLLSLSGKNPLNFDSVHYRLTRGQVVLGSAISRQDYAAVDVSRARLVHRLDFGTSGIMLVALNKQSCSVLSLQFQSRSVSKTYTAMLQGGLQNESGILDYPIAKDQAIFPRLKVCAQTGKAARSGYRVIEYLPEGDRTRVEFTPLTGRTHQLRIHSLAMGHPILGCDLYSIDDSETKADRLLLHASELHFDHPITGERMKGLSPCPF